MALLIYNPQLMIPDEGDVEAGNNFINFISHEEGEAFIPNHPDYTRLAGKTPHLSGKLLKKFIVFENDEISGIPPELNEAISSKFFSVIVIDEPIDYWLDIISPYYLNERKFFESGDEFFTVSGRKNRPQFIYRPQ